MSEFDALILTADTTGLERGVLALEQTTKAAAKTEAAAESLAVAAHGVGHRMSGASSNIRQVGLQLSQVVQMGQMTGQWAQSFAIQAADIGLAFGGAGMVIGAMATIAIPQLVAAFQSAVDNIEPLRAAVDAISDTFGAAVDFMADNLDRLAIYAGVAAAGFTLYMTPAIIGATVAAGRFVVALVATRAALMATGIGVLVIAAGELAYQFARLVDGAGSFGAALALVGDVAYEVFGRLSAGAEYVNSSFWALAAGMEASFLGALNKMAGAYIEFTWSVADGINSLFGTDLIGANAEITQTIGRSAAAADSAAQSYAASANAALAAFNAPIKSLGALNDAMSRSDGLLGDFASGAGDAEDATKGAGKSAKELAKQIEGPLTSAIKSASDAFGDFVVRGFSDFNGFVDDVVNSFKRMISQLISTAISNKIMLSLGIGGSITGTAASAGTSLLTGGAGLFGGIGSAAGGIWSGLGGVLSGGGLGSSFANLGGLLTGASSGLGAIGAAIPAAGIVALGLSALIGSKKITGQGVKGTFSGGEVDAKAYTTTQTSRLFGLIKSTSTATSKAPAAITSALDAAAASVYATVSGLAENIGISADTLDGVTLKFKASLKGLTQAEAIEKLQAQVDKYGEKLAKTALQSYAVAGETYLETLTRLSNSLTTVNTAFDQLGWSLYSVSLSGAKAASSFTDLLGGLDSFQTVTSAYYEAFYSSAERAAITTRILAEQFADLGLSLPSTREGYRALVDAAMSAGDTELAANLLSMSSAFVTITESADDAATSVKALADALDENDFATLLDYQRARVATLMGYGYNVTSSGSTSVGGSSGVSTGTTTATGSDNALLTEIRALLVEVSKNSGSAARMLVRWDDDGMPEVRTA